uniref:Uncharacterized protein n=1 Tax=Kalanchoe fedtschenkoi TaxID=63787 RepID=A0A7N0ZYB7_KALFE
MGYLLRVRFAAFFAGAAAASLGGLYLLQKDYKVAHESISKQVCFGFSIFCLLFFRVLFGACVNCWN